VPHQIIWSWYTGRWWVGGYIWYSEEGTGRGPSPPRPLLAVPNVTAHPSTASVPITVLLCNGPLLCGFNVGSKGLTYCRYFLLFLGNVWLHWWVYSRLVYRVVGLMAMQSIPKTWRLSSGGGNGSKSIVIGSNCELPISSSGDGRLLKGWRYLRPLPVMLWNAMTAVILDFTAPTRKPDIEARFRH